MLHRIGSLRWRGLWAALRRLDARLWQLSDSAAPDWFRQPSVRQVLALRSVVTLGMQLGKSRCELWHGSEKKTGARLRAAFIGGASAFPGVSEYWKKILFRDVPQVAPVGAGWDWQTRRLAKQASAQADLVIVDCHQLLAWRSAPGAGGYFHTPSYVGMQMAFPPGAPWSAIERGMALQKENIRTFRKTGFTFSISHDPADFDLFYERMHVPMIRERHAGYGSVLDQAGLRPLFDLGGLMLVHTLDGQTVAGLLYRLCGKAILLASSGILDMDMRWYECGANGALYYESLRWCHENGFALAVYGKNRPFTTDGVYIFKHRWGMQPIVDVWTVRDWLLWTPGDAPVALDWVQAHPLVQVPA